jgi:hypothetical protein
MPKGSTLAQPRGHLVDIYLFFNAKNLDILRGLVNIYSHTPGLKNGSALELLILHRIV